MLYLGHCLIKMRFLIMNEDSFISPALTGDINERLEKRFADEAVRRQSFNEIENIAKILRIGKKFKVPQAELLYQLSDKSPLELYRIGRVCKKFAGIAEALGDNDDDKNLLCRVLNNYVREQMPLDREGILADKIAETFPKVLNYARPDDITVSVFLQQASRGACRIQQKGNCRQVLFGRLRRVGGQFGTDKNADFRQTESERRR